MEDKEAEKTPIAKPVPSRPSCSNFTSFSELLNGAIDSPPRSPSAETTSGAIRPKTVRLKPASDRAPVGMLPPQAEVSGAGVSLPSDKSTVLYKPLAKVVSKKTLSVLANLGNSSISPQQAPVGVEEPLNQSMYPSNHHGHLQAESERGKLTETWERGNENMEDDDQKSFQQASVADRPSYDGYNWRKYGQKQVKGSEYPRSYYKCTHPNCPVKKMVERLLDGQIAEIVYKGEHNHLKPQPPKRHSGGGGHGEEFASDGTGTGTGQEMNHRPPSESQNEVGFSSGKGLISGDGVFPGDIDALLGAPENYFGLAGDHEEVNKAVVVEDDKPKRKRRKHEKESGVSAEALQEPRAATQNLADTESSGDGFRWRKYGQKVVKGNTYPRSYYKCTNLNCNVRKHVERASDDPTAFLTTYEGKHNHEMPGVKNANTAEPDSSLPATSKNRP